MERLRRGDDPGHARRRPGVATYDQAWVEARNGVRSPGYRTSPKAFRLGFVYIARDLAEVRAVYQPMERSIVHFTTAEAIDRLTFRFQVPFLVATGFRASVDARLADLDGNTTPTIAVVGAPYVVAAGGAASVPVVSADPDGAPPSVSCVPASSACAVAGGFVTVTGLAPGTHFFTVKAQDAGGKRAFAHFVVDVP